MWSALRDVARAVGINPRALYQELSAASIDAAAKEQGLNALRDKLREIMPSVENQYTIALDPDEYSRYWERKMRTLHAFQIQVALEALSSLSGENLVLADIGDSSGNHALYIRALTPPGRVGRVISVNLDPVAVDKVLAKGGDAILCRAEEMDLQGVRPDLFLSFEMVEHLTDPVRFLHRLAEQGSADHMLVTVPYRKVSRFGGHDLRLPLARLPDQMTPEEVHIFELAPEDWLLLARFAGWRPIFTRRYLQYPLYHPLRATAPLWRKLDYEGFFALFLKRDLSLAKRYSGW